MLRLALGLIRIHLCSMGKSAPSGRFSRREAIRLAAGVSVLAVAPTARAGDNQTGFISEAFRMRRDAIAAGDQPFGAVLVVDGAIAGFGPSRVILDSDPDAHAERVALWDAQRRLGRNDLPGAVIYSTSRPCMACQAALAVAGVARMIHGRDGTDAGAPGA